MTNDVLKEDKSICFNELHLLNKKLILVTLVVSKPNKFTDVKELHPENNELISFKLLKLFVGNLTSPKLIEFSNIDFIFSNEEKSKVDKSIELKPLQL